MSNLRGEWPSLSYRASAVLSFRTLAAGLFAALLGLAVSAIERRATAVIVSGVVIAFLAWRMTCIRCPKCGHRLLYYQHQWVGWLPMRCRYCGLGIRQSWLR